MCWGGAAMVVAGRCCWGLGAGAATVGREGARPTERWRGIVTLTGFAGGLLGWFEYEDG